MEREEFFEWLNTCPCHKWEVVFDDAENLWVSFSNIFEYEEDDDA